MPRHEIVLYATGDCPHCRAARAALEASGHPFEERDPLSSRARLKELMLLSAVATVPTIVVSGQVLAGFDASRLEEMLRDVPPVPEPEEEYTPEEIVPDDGEPAEE
jgi:glutaredoxin